MGGQKAGVIKGIKKKRMKGKGEKKRRRWLTWWKGGRQAKTFFNKGDPFWRWICGRVVGFARRR